jgi:hypothetical protein
VTGKDTCDFKKGWEILSRHNFRSANVVSVYHETAVKKNLPIITAPTAEDLSDRQSIMLIVNESIFKGN